MMVTPGRRWGPAIAASSGDGDDNFAHVLRRSGHREHGRGVSVQPAPLRRGRRGHVSTLEGLYYVIGVGSLCLGWYFNIRYVHAYRHAASYVNYTKMLFSNWAADSAAQDYTIVNVLLLPLWTIVDGRRRGMRVPWIFFVMSLFTSLAFSMAMYLAFVERSVRYEREPSAAPGPRSRSCSRG